MSTTASSPTDATPQLLLEHHLKHLRLPTILREYDKVARQCAVEQVDFPRFLLRLTELELLDRDRRATERRIRQAKFSVVKTLDTFDFLAIPSANKTLVLDLARCEFLPRKENVLLLGNSDSATFCTSLLPSFIGKENDIIQALIYTHQQTKDDVEGLAHFGTVSLL